MTYHYLEDFAIADIAFEAAGKNLEELFIAAADATMNVMVEEIGAINRAICGRSSCETGRWRCCFSTSSRS